MHSCRIKHSDLPSQIPVFPLTGVLLLPQAQLPLNIFEPRYLDMVDDALTSHRIIGMVQPKPCGSLYTTGCAGRIVEFMEAEGERYLVTLTGLCRFRIRAEIPTNKAYRSVHADFTDFAKDMDTALQAPAMALDRQKLDSILKTYFRKQDLDCDWRKIEAAPDIELLNALSMICPLRPQEKQALLEAETLEKRASLFMTMLEMAINTETDDERCH